MSASAIQAIGAVDPASLDPASQARTQPGSGESFAKMMLGGVEQANQKLLDADTMVKAFALDDSVPLHQVMYAIQKAHGSFEMMLQVRSQLVSVYQEFSRMEL